MIHNTAPHKHVLTMSRLLKAAQRELTTINEILLPAAPTTEPKVENIGHKRRRRAIRTSAQKPRNPNAPRRLSDTERHDMKVLLTETNLPVETIAALFKVTRASVYQNRDRMGLDVRRKHPRTENAEEAPQAAATEPAVAIG